MVDISNKEMKEAEQWFQGILSEVNESGRPIANFMEVTPARASVLLKHNPNNRKIRPVKLEQLTSDMANGRYHVNGESIIVSSEGQLNDGQHRLTAILKTGLAQIVNMAFGVSRDSRKTVDQGAARTAGDHLGVLGITNSNVTAATCRKIISYKNTGTFNSTNRISGTEIIETINKDQTIHEFASWASNHNSRFKHVNITASEIASIFYFLSEKAPKQAKQFMEMFRDGLYLTPESPIHALRQALITRPRLNPNNRLELILRAWNLWIKDKPATTLVLRGRIPEILTAGRSRNDDEQ